MMNFEAMKKMTVEAEANLDRALTSLTQGIAAFQQIAGDLNANSLRQCVIDYKQIVR